jgi:predicted AAA+ superfamily ATPase
LNAIVKNRILREWLLRKAQGRFGRLVAVTGARQTGKTTLVRECFGEMAYISLDDPLTRRDYTGLAVPEWHARYPQAVLDEVQKAPALFDTLKGLHDRYEDTRYVITGSAQFLMLGAVSESLAGRVRILELYPLTLPERLTSGWGEPVAQSLLIRMLRSGNFGQAERIPTATERFAQASREWERYLDIGGYPAVAEETVEQARDWLADYVRTYLQRDVRDLANLRDLEPFVAAQKASALMTGRITNFSEIAKAAGITGQTARRFVRYLELSYQVLLLPPWFRNAAKRLRKSPKLHYLDPGVLRAITRRTGPLTGHEFESAVVAEIHKQIRTHELPAELYHLSTVDGREVDLLIELEQGYIAIEVKQAEKVNRQDARHLAGIGTLLDKPVLARWVLSNDKSVRPLAPGVTALPVAWLFA